MRISKKPTFFAVALCLFATFAAILAGCGGSGGASASGAGTGQMAVHMVDAPPVGISGLTALNVTISSVQANVNNNWVTIGTPNQTYNLLDFQTHDVLLAQGPLPAGNYSQIRLIVTSATATDSTGTHDVNIPSGSQTGIKINVDAPVQANVITDVLIDFKAGQSLHVLGNGQYQLQPVVTGTLKILSGTISGTVTSNGSPAAGAQVDAVYAAGTNYPLGTLVNTSLTQADGTFKIWTLLPGTYTLNISWTIPNTSTVQQAHVFNVVVVAAQDTNVGTVALFTPGSVSGTVMNGANPVAGASVTAAYTAGGNLINGTVIGPVTSAADGTFSITGLPPGTYTITATSGAMFGSVTSVVVTAGTNTAAGSVSIL